MTTTQEIVNSEVEQERDGSRRMDPELRIMGQMLRMLDELDVRTGSRIVAWLSARFHEARGE